ncbi:DUF5060 domain-containing protein [Fretibacter rubidus]|uniref:DUF5060 domain-containing protein n=1 Tax=Fretibacter rubidus TaxID=570162 RepID=UPI00352B7FBC
MTAQRHINRKACLHLTKAIKALLLILSIFFALLTSQAMAQEVETSGAVFDRVTLSIDGPEMDERGEINPFSDIRLDWIISKEDNEWTVPGYFAACGNAADTGCTSGKTWRAHFLPSEQGEYKWKVRFRQGTDIAIGTPAGTPLEKDGLRGRFSIMKLSKDSITARGILSYTGEPYYQYSGDNSLFFKFGPDAPENMLAYSEFDATPNFKNFRKDWAAHRKDYTRSGQPFLWQKNKGKGILGMLEYLATSGVNSVSMLLWNTGGDDRNVFPHLLAVDEAEYIAMKPKEQWDTGTIQDRLDVSKLEQWHKTFSYADSLGIHLHFKLQETENNLFMDDSALGRTRKIYIREMMARFGHMLALSWNIGEENVQHPGDIRHMINYIASYNLYNHPIVLHSYPDQKERYRPFLGPNTQLNGLSLQGWQDDYSDLRRDVTNWANTVALSGKNLVLAYDEPGRADGGATVDIDYPDALLPSKREITISSEDFLRDALWNALTAGANGVEAYYGYKTGCSDLDCQDHRTRASLWEGGRMALGFFQNHIGDKALTMRANDLTTVAHDDYVFANPGELYVIIPGAEEVQLRLPGMQGKFTVDWYDRSLGGALQTGSKPFVMGGASSITDKNRRRQGPSSVGLGRPPSSGSGQWAILVRRAESNDIRVEAESFTSQRKSEKRQWCRSDTCAADWQTFDTDNSGYTAIIPDTRLTHDDTLIPGENFSNQPGQMTIASYTVDFPMAGRYYVWVRTYSRGSEDNSVHVGLNGEWPKSGARMQFCPGRHKWYWDNRQRTIDDHCGVIGGIWIDVPSAGQHTVEFSMREDGFVMDAFYLTLSSQMPAMLQKENEDAKPTTIRK